tara:strand:- start:117 stop:371 length:255 start_codon:yes stop_codon:yes gene_type:complete
VVEQVLVVVLLQLLVDQEVLEVVEMEDGLQLVEQEIHLPYHLLKEIMADKLEMQLIIKEVVVVEHLQLDKLIMQLQQQVQVVMV